MSADQRLYWGVVIFWVARRLLSTDGGKYWWLLRRLLRLGLDLIELASTQGVASLTVLQKLRAGTLQGGDILSIAPASNFVGVSRDPVLSDPAGWPTARLPATGADSAQATRIQAGGRRRCSTSSTARRCPDARWCTRTSPAWSPASSTRCRPR